MKNLILVIAKSLLDRPDKVKVAEVNDVRITVLKLKVAKEDFGEVNW